MAYGPSLRGAAHVLLALRDYNKEVKFYSALSLHTEKGGGINGYSCCCDGPASPADRS